MYKVYSDGACKGNPGPGGWGAVVVDSNGVRQEFYGGEMDTTNQRMELRAAYEAIKHTPVGADVEICTDSKYAINCMTQWVYGWVKKDWKSANGDVKHQDILKPMYDLIRTRNVEWTWVKGHSGHIENERCDALANMGVSSLGIAQAPKANSAVIGADALTLGDDTWHVYTDGGYRSSSSIGGWGVVVRAPDGTTKEYFGSDKNVSNNKMELMAAIMGLQAIPKGANAVLYSDSQYTLKGIAEWLPGWKERGWRTASGAEVKNQSLWVQMESLAGDRNMQWNWIRGHNEHLENERCDALANYAMDHHGAIANVTPNPEPSVSSIDCDGSFSL